MWIKDYFKSTNKYDDKITIDLSVSQFVYNLFWMFLSNIFTIS